MRPRFPSPALRLKRGGVIRRFALTQRWAAVLAVLLALLLRGGIPDGYMLGTDASGAVTVELCSGKTMVMSMPMEHGAGHDHDGQPREMPCPFGVLGAPAMPSVPPLLVVAPPAIAPVLLAAALPVFLAPQAAAPPPPSTGPPSLT